MKKEHQGYIITNDNAPNKSKIGYVRISSADQNEARQLEAFKDLALYKIFVDKLSGKDTNRPMLQKMLAYATSGDTIYIRDFSRLARNTKDLLDITGNLTENGITLINLEQNIDTSTPVGKVMMTMLGAFYTFERENAKIRQAEGIAIAKAEGRYKGRATVPKPHNWPEIYEHYRTRRMSGNDAIKALSLTRSTFYKFVNEERKSLA
jgi:DNA invertase Pin-like site-specific DNA recombinase